MRLVAWMLVSAAMVSIASTAWAVGALARREKTQTGGNCALSRELPPGVAAVTAIDEASAGTSRPACDRAELGPAGPPDDCVQDLKQTGCMLLTSLNRVAEKQ